MKRRALSLPRRYQIRTSVSKTTVCTVALESVFALGLFHWCEHSNGLTPVCNENLLAPAYLIKQSGGFLSEIFGGCGSHAHLPFKCLLHSIHFPCPNQSKP